MTTGNENDINHSSAANEIQSPRETGNERFIRLAAFAAIILLSCLGVIAVLVVALEVVHFEQGAPI